MFISFHLSASVALAIVAFHVGMSLIFGMRALWEERTQLTDPVPAFRWKAYAAVAAAFVIGMLPILNIIMAAQVLHTLWLKRH